MPSSSIPISPRDRDAVSRNWIRREGLSEEGSCPLGLDCPGHVIGAHLCVSLPFSRSRELVLHPVPCFHKHIDSILYIGQEFGYLGMYHIRSGEWQAYVHRAQLLHPLCPKQSRTFESNGYAFLERLSHETDPSPPLLEFLWRVA